MNNKRLNRKEHYKTRSDKRLGTKELRITIRNSRIVKKKERRTMRIYKRGRMQYKRRTLDMMLGRNCIKKMNIRMGRREKKGIN